MYVTSEICNNIRAPNLFNAIVLCLNASKNRVCTVVEDWWLKSITSESSESFNESYSYFRSLFSLDVSDDPLNYWRQTQIIILNVTYIVVNNNLNNSSIIDDKEMTEQLESQ